MPSCIKVVVTALSMLQMGNPRFQDTACSPASTDSFYGLWIGKEGPCSPHIYSLVDGRAGIPTRSVTKALDYFPLKTLVSDLSITQRSHLLLKWDLPPLAKSPLSYFRWSQGGLACGPEQARSAVGLYHLPAGSRCPTALCSLLRKRLPRPLQLCSSANTGPFASQSWVRSFPSFPPAASPLPSRNWRESTAAWTRDSILRLSSPLSLRLHYFQNLSFLGIVIIAYSHLTFNETDPVPSTLPGLTSLGGRYYKCSVPIVQMRKLRAKAVETWPWSRSS